MDNLNELWRAHESDRFPAGLGGKEIAGTDLALLDADIAGCVSSAAGSAGKLDSGRLDILRKCRKEVENVIPELTGNDKRYFERLKRMVELVLKRYED